MWCGGMCVCCLHFDEGLMPDMHVCVFEVKRAYGLFTVYVHCAQRIRVIIICSFAHFFSPSSSSSDVGLSSSTLSLWLFFLSYFRRYNGIAVNAIINGYFGLTLIWRKRDRQTKRKNEQKSEKKTDPK